LSESLPVEISPVYEGERIRKKDMYVELGGPDVQYKCELVIAKPMDEIQDGKISVMGSDLNELEEGKSYPFSLLVEVAGEMVEKDLESSLKEGFTTSPTTLRAICI
jgi:acetyl-CoA decarbonylase/synthase complex subunit beta